jgi:chromosome segregation ATPase
MQVIIAEMALCLLAALLIGALFGYLYARAKSKERYEDKIDALQELCESKRKESEQLKTAFGRLEVDNNKLIEENEHIENLLVECREKEEELLTQLDILVQENESLHQKLKQCPDEESVTKEMLLDKISDIKKTVADLGSDLEDEIKAEIKEGIEEVEKLVEKEVENKKVMGYLSTLFGKIKS